MPVPISGLDRRSFLALLTPQYEESRGQTPWVPSPDEVIATMLRLARVTAKDTVYDLGCGDGRIVIAAARDFRARAVGIDIEPERIAEARAAADLAGVGGKVRFVVEDFHQSDVSEATVVALYLFTAEIAKLKPRLLAQLKPGSRVVAYQFNGMGDWKPSKIVRKHHYPVFLWTVPGPRR
jgi:ubiquinone/menaquinone biosynthesis C-methylase UbiE